MPLLETGEKDDLAKPGGQRIHGRWGRHAKFADRARRPDLVMQGSAYCRTTQTSLCVYQYLWALVWCSSPTLNAERDEGTSSQEGPMSATKSWRCQKTLDWLGPYACGSLSRASLGSDAQDDGKPVRERHRVFNVPRRMPRGMMLACADVLAPAASASRSVWMSAAQRIRQAIE
jgi:hypothetical protein